jgi:hypothetical protein
VTPAIEPSRQTEGENRWPIIFYLILGATAQRMLREANKRLPARASEQVIGADDDEGSRANDHQNFRKFVSLPNSKQHGTLTVPRHLTKCPPSTGAELCPNSEKATECCVTAKRRFGPKPDQVPRSKEHRYSITSSAVASSDVGTLTPSALAVLRLMASSNLVGCSTGRSLGFAPLRILSTVVAPRRNASGQFAP